MEINLEEFSHELAKKAKRYGADIAEIIASHNHSNSVEMRLGQIASIEESANYAMGLRVIIGKKQAFVSSNYLAEENIDALAARAVDIAKASTDDIYLTVAKESEYIKNIPDLELVDRYYPTIDELKQKAEEAEAIALQEKNIVNSEGSEATASKSEVAILLDGFYHSYHSSSFSLSLAVIAKDGNDMQVDYQVSMDRFYRNLASPASIGKDAAGRARRKLHAKKLSSSKLPVIYEPRVAKSLLGYFAGAINGASVARGTSFLQDSLGKTVFSPNIGIIDDPLMRGGLASRPYDCEGLPSKRLVLVNNDGILRSWFLDLRSAKKLAMNSTASAIRGFASAPSPSSSNLYIEPGELSPEQMISGIKKGIYITDLFGGGVSGITGDYSQGAAGIMIENGELTTPVNEFTLGGNLKNMFLNIQAANDLEFKYSINTPSLLLENMIVAGL